MNPDMPVETLTYDCHGQHLVTRRWGSGNAHAVLLHGFPDNADSMAPLARQLVAEGYQVWAPFLRGYHPSSLAADNRYDMIALAGDLCRFLELIGTKNCTLVGHDWGAAIAYAVSALDGPGINRVVGISVPPVPSFLKACRGPSKQILRSAYMFGFQFKGAAELRLRRKDMAGIEALWRKWSPDWEPPPEQLQAVKDSLALPGHLSAALGYYRAMRPGFSKRSRDNWALMHQRPVHPVSCMVGANDTCIPPEAFRFVEYPVEIVPGAGHFLPLEAPGAIRAHILGG